MPSTADQSKAPNFARRIKWLGIGTILVFVLYSAVWFYIAREAETRLNLALEKLSQRGTQISCGQSEIKGYPFRLGLFCDSVKFEQPLKGVTFAGGALRSAAQVYNPWHAIIELDGPAQLVVPEQDPLVLNWDLFHASARLSRPLPERVSFETKALVIAKNDPSGTGAPLLSADYLSGHMRKEDNHVGFAGEAAAVTLDPVLVAGRTLPKFATSFDVVLNDGVSLLRVRPKSLRGLSSLVRQIQVIFDDGGALQLNGPLSVDQDGLVDADFALFAREPIKLGNALSMVAPEATDIITRTMKALELTNGSDGESEINIKIRKGRVLLGFIPLAKIPPVR